MYNYRYHRWETEYTYKVYKTIPTDGDYYNTMGIRAMVGGVRRKIPAHLKYLRECYCLLPNAPVPTGTVRRLPRLDPDTLVHRLPLGTIIFSAVTSTCRSVVCEPDLMILFVPDPHRPPGLQMLYQKLQPRHHYLYSGWLLDPKKLYTNLEVAREFRRWVSTVPTSDLYRVLNAISDGALI